MESTFIFIRPCNLKQLYVPVRLAMGLECIGNLAMGLECIGNLAMGLECIGNLAMGLVCIGNFAMGLECIGLAMGLECMGNTFVNFTMCYQADKRLYSLIFGDPHAVT
jgi:hypothetical protein